MDFVKTGFTVEVGEIMTGLECWGLCFRLKSFLKAIVNHWKLLIEGDYTIRAH